MRSLRAPVSLLGLFALSLVAAACCKCPPIIISPDGVRAGGGAIVPLPKPNDTREHLGPTATNQPASKNAAPPPGPRPSAANLKIVIAEDAVTINGKAIPEKPLPAEMEAILGAPDRTLDLSNTLLVYDDLGLVLYVKPSIGRVTQLSIFYNRLDFDFMPANLYSGALSIYGQTVLKSPTINGLKRVLPEMEYQDTMDQYTLPVRGKELWIEPVQGADSVAQFALSFPEEE